MWVGFTGFLLGFYWVFTVFFVHHDRQMSTPGSGNLNASTFSRNPNNFLQQFEQFTMVGWQKKTKKKNSANPLAFVFFDPNISLFPFYDLCVCVFFWFLCFFCFCLLEMANRRTRIPNRRHHTSTITGPTTNKTFSDRLPFYFHLFFLVSTSKILRLSRLLVLGN